MDNYKVFIVEDNYNWADTLAEIINKQDEFDVVGIANDGTEVLTQIEALKPDIILMDIVLPFYDGVYLIQYIKNHFDYNPVIIVLSCLGTDTLIRLTNEFNIKYYFNKPIDPEAFVMALKKIADEIETVRPVFKISREAIISETLTKIGVPLHLRSYDYLKDAIELCLDNEEYQHLITKLLYPDIAKKRKTDSKHIERGIRYSVISTKRKNNAFYKEIFGSMKITNSSFINLLTEYIKKELKSSN